MTWAGGDIVHVVERTRGGVATHVAELMTLQRASGRWGRVVLIADPRFLEPELLAAADVVLPYRSTRSPSELFSSTREVQNLIAEVAPAVVHLHSSFPGVYGRLLAADDAEAPAIVYCPHGWAFEMECSKAKRTFYAWAERRLAHEADVIVSVSEHERQAAIDAGVRHDGHLTIRHGAPEASPGASVDLGADVINLLFVGRFDRQKGLDLLLDGLAQSRRKDIRLHLIGDGDRKDGASRQDDPRVIEHGWIAHDALDSWYRAADAVVMPSRWEGFGLVAIEAMRNGTPVLASRCGALPEVVNDAGLLFDPKDPAAIAAMIDSLSLDDLREMGALALNRYNSTFTAERAAAELESAYDLALERRLRRKVKQAQFDRYEAGRPRRSPGEGLSDGASKSHHRRRAEMRHLLPLSMASRSSGR